MFNQAWKLELLNWIWNANVDFAYGVLTISTIGREIVASHNIIIFSMSSIAFKMSFICTCI